MKKSINLFLFFLLLVNFSRAQNNSTHGPWNMQQCIDYALKTNLQLRQTELNADQAKINLTQSEAGALPNLNAGAQHSYNIGRTIDQYTNTFANSAVLSQNLYLSSGLTLFNGLQRYNTIKQNQYSYAAGKYDVDKNRNDISLNIAAGYLQILLNQELLDVAQNQLEITKKQLERTQRLYDAGTVAKGNVLDLQAQQARDELSLANAENMVDLSYLTLVQLMNLDSTKGFQVQKPELNMSLDNVLLNEPSQVYKEAVKQLPEVKSAELKLMSAEKGIASAKGAISPQLSLNASLATGYSGLSKSLQSYSISGYDIIGYTTSGEAVLTPHFVPVFQDNSFSKQYSDNINKTLGLRLTIPLFNGLQTHASIVSARIASDRAKLTVDQTKLTLFKTIQQAYADANAALKKYVATKKAVEATEESFKYSEQKYNVGALNVFDYNLAKTNLAKAKSDLVQAKYDFVFKTKVLDFYQGKPLTL